MFSSEHLDSLKHIDVRMYLCRNNEINCCLLLLPLEPSKFTRPRLM